MTMTDLKARITRLDELARGLSREVVLWKTGNDPLLYAERKAYLNSIQDALAGVEASRVVLSKVRQRLEGENEARARARRPSAPDRRQRTTPAYATRPGNSPHAPAPLPPRSERSTGKLSTFLNG